MNAAERYQHARLAELDAALAADDYEQLSWSADSYARLSARDALLWNFGNARDWAVLYQAARERIDTLMSRREGLGGSEPGVA